MNWLANLLSGGVVKSVEEVAKEWITTPEEEASAKYKSAEAKTLLLKVLDPNGMMRRGISRKVSNAYMTYLGVTMLLILLQSFEIGNTEQVKLAVQNITELFVPITTMFSAIVGASFGVNGMNTVKGK